MATNEIFDKETILDLTVNFVPLFIILFFIGVLLVTNPWSDIGSFGLIIALGLHVVPFVSLALLTYVSAKIIAGDEKTKTVFPPGQATVPNTPPLEEDHGDDSESAAIEGTTTGTPATEDDAGAANDGTGAGDEPGADATDESGAESGERAADPAAGETAESTDSDDERSA